MKKANTNKDGKDQGTGGKACWKGYRRVGANGCVKMEKFNDLYNAHLESFCSAEHGYSEDVLDELELGEAQKKLNKPFRTPNGPKKFSVYVKNDNGNIVKVNFGDPNMSIKRDDPESRKNFRSRHNCANPGPKWKARYWSCRFWSKKAVSKMV
jgi:hypothetical protein